MHDGVPTGARPVARVLILDGDRVLLQCARDGERQWWVAPGGGLEHGETFEQAALREVKEETGLEIELGPWIWTRRHQYELWGRAFDQYERFFVAKQIGAAGAAVRPDAYVVGSRWWRVDELRAAEETFAPRRLPSLIVDVVAGRYPADPVDCGV
jgi:8-oxo-dGTP pyrophosphatase MutT (NUDIX family)